MINLKARLIIYSLQFKVVMDILSSVVSIEEQFTYYN